MRGRKPRLEMVDGDLVIIKKPVRVRSSWAIFLPKEWIDLVSMEHDPTAFLLSYDSSQMTIKPYYEALVEV